MNTQQQNEQSELEVFVVYRPFGAPKASIWDFGMIHVCVNVGCFPFDCPFFCRFANVIFFELAVFSF